MAGQKKPGLARELWELIKETYAEWSQDKAPQLGAALAFYTIFSLAPIFLIIVAVVGYVLGKESVQVYLVKEMATFIGQENAVNIMNTVKASHQPGSGLRATLVAISLMLVGSTTIVVMLKNALNIIWGVEPQEQGYVWGIIKERVKSFLVVLLVGVFLFLSIIASSILSALNKFLGSYAEIPVFFYQLLDFGVSLALLTFLFAMLYKVLPDASIAWKDVWIGSAITALLFTLGKFFLGLYIARSGTSSVYGAAGSLVVILLWVYYSAQIIFIGAEFTQVYARRYGSAIEPGSLP
ncbi:MAG: YihY/virulence factor BrkB family protein [Deltaproteobacteria bacterium]|nr:YihY/virulence factor BrkB family protein [Deltaproteobacteria bacterium]